MRSISVLLLLLYLYYFIIFIILSFLLLYLYYFIIFIIVSLMSLDENFTFQSSDINVDSFVFVKIRSEDLQFTRTPDVQVKQIEIEIKKVNESITFDLENNSDDVSRKPPPINQLTINNARAAK